MPIHDTTYQTNTDKGRFTVSDSANPTIEHVGRDSIYTGEDSGVPKSDYLKLLALVEENKSDLARIEKLLHETDLTDETHNQAFEHLRKERDNAIEELHRIRRERDIAVTILQQHKKTISNFFGNKHVYRNGRL